jgi:cytochrome c biogenesis protein CcdA
MWSDNSLGHLLFTESPVILAAVLALILAITRIGSRPGPALLAAFAALLLGAASVIHVAGLNYLINDASAADIRDWLDIIGWTTTIMIGLAFVLLALAFLLGSSRPRQPVPPRWNPPPQGPWPRS